MLLTVSLIFTFHLFRYLAYLNLEIYEMDIWNTEIKSTVIYRIDAILFGFIVSWIHYFYKDFLHKIRVYLFIVAAHLFFLQFAVMNVLRFDLINTPLYSKVFYFTLTSTTVALGLPFFISWKQTLSFIRIPIEFVSKVSYSMYLLHYSIVAVLLKQGLLYLNLELSSLPLLVLYLLSTMILSFLLYRFFEKPIMDIRDK